MFLWKAGPTLGLLMGLMVPIAMGQGPPTTAPIDKGDQVGPDPRIVALLGPIREKHELPALGAAIVTGDRLIGVGVVGVRRLGDPTRATHRDTFHIGSCTKAMTATLLALLVRDGKLTWETTLEDALPDLARTMDPAYRRVTIEQLLAQRSGFSAESAARDLSILQMHALPGTNREKRGAYLKRILGEPPDVPVGQRFVYSNRNYVAAGAIAEKVSGQEWESLITTRLFRPLKMGSAGFGAMGHGNRVDQPWQHLVKDGKVVPVGPGPRSDNPALMGPAGTVHVSLADWGKFAAAHLRGAAGKSGILPAEDFRRIQTPATGQTYAFGWGFADRPWGGGTVLTHAGSNTMNYAVIWLAPRRDFAVLVVTNQGGEEAEKACDEAASAMIGLHLGAAKG